MERTKRFLAMMLSVFMLCGVMTVSMHTFAYAETVLQDGIEVTLTTDKESYEALEVIDARLTVRNTTSESVQNVEMEISAPEGYLLLDNSIAKDVELKPGETQSQQSSMRDTNASVPTLPKTGDNSSAMLWALLFAMSAGTLCVLIARNPQGKRIFSLILCFVMVGSIVLEAVPVYAQADDATAEKKTLSVSKGIIVDGELVEITGEVAYDAPAMTFTLSRSVQETPASDFYYLANRDDTITITRYIGNDEILVIPSTIDGKPVNSIGDGRRSIFDGFSGSKTVKSVVLPDGLKRIEADAFAESYSLENVEFPSNGSIEYIGGGAFVACDKLEEVYIYSAAEELSIATYVDENGSTFSHCDNLKRVTIIADGDFYTGNDVFARCYALEEVFISSGKHLGLYDNAFKDCELLGSIKLEAGTSASIGDSVFSGCIELFDVSLPETLTSIGHNAFSLCRFVSVLVVSADVEYIGEYAFDNCGTASFAGNLTIYGYKGSYVESYIEDNNQGKEVGDTDYITFIAIDDPNPDRYITVSDYKINGHEKEITVSEGMSLNLRGMLTPSTGAKITEIRVFIHEASATLLDGDVHVHYKDINAEKFNLAEIASITVGEEFGEGEVKQKMTAGNSYAVMLWAYDSNDNGLIDTDMFKDLYQGPSIIVHVCEHPDDQHNTSLDTSATKRYRLNPDDLTTHELGHQVGQIYNRYCGKCGMFLKELLIWSTNTESHQMNDGVCSLCGYVEQKPECLHTEYTDHYNKDYPIQYTKKDETSHYYQLGYDRDCNSCDAVWQVYSDLSEDTVAPHDFTNGDICICGYDISGCVHLTYTDVYNENIPVKYTDNKDEKTHIWQNGFDRICDICHKNIGTVYGEENTSDHDYSNGDVCPCGYDRNNCQHVPVDSSKGYVKTIFEAEDASTHKAVADVVSYVCSKCTMYYEKIEQRPEERVEKGIPHAWGSNGMCQSLGCGYACEHDGEWIKGSAVLGTGKFKKISETKHQRVSVDYEYACATCNYVEIRTTSEIGEKKSHLMKWHLTSGYEVSKDGSHHRKVGKEVCKWSADGKTHYCLDQYGNRHYKDAFGPWEEHDFDEQGKCKTCGHEKLETGYEIAVVLNGRDIICDKYSFNPKESNTYFGLRAYYNGQMIDTTSDNPEYKFVFNYGNIDDYMCIYDFTINPKTNYFTGFHKDYWLIQKLDAFTFRYNPKVDSKGIVQLVDKSNKEVASIQLVVRPDGRYVTGEDVGYDPDEWMYTYEVLLPVNAYSFWDSTATSMDAKRLWFDLQVQGTYVRMMNAITTINLEAFMEAYSKDSEVLRFSVATQNITSLAFDSVSSVATTGLKGTFTGYLNTLDILKGTGMQIYAGMAGMDVDFTQTWKDTWQGIEARNDAMLSEAKKTFAPLQGLTDKDAVIAKAIVDYLTTTIPEDMNDVQFTAADISSNGLKAQKTAKNIEKIVTNLLNQYLDGQLKTTNITITGDKANDFIAALKQSDIDLSSFSESQMQGKLTDYIDLDASNLVIRDAVNNWEKYAQDVDGDGVKKATINGLAYTDKMHWLLLDEKYGDNRIYKKVKTLLQNEKFDKYTKNLGYIVSGVLGAIKVYDTMNKYQKILDQWENELTQKRDQFPADSKQYRIYDETIKELRNGVEQGVSNIIFEAIKPFALGEMALKDLPTYVAKALGITLSLPVQLAALGLNITVADNADSKGKMWKLEDVYREYSSAKGKLIEELDRFKKTPSAENFQSVEAWMAYYQILRVAAISMMESIVKSDASRWSDTIILSIIDLSSFSLPKAFLGWIKTGDPAAFSLAKDRLEDKKEMEIMIDDAKKQDMNTVIHLDGYVFPLRESYGWIKEELK